MAIIDPQSGQALGSDHLKCHDVIRVDDGAPDQSWYVDSSGNFVGANGINIQTDKVRALNGDGLYLVNDGGDGIFVRDSGIIDTAKQSSCRMYLSTGNNQSISDDTTTKVNFNTDSWDTQNETDPSTDHDITVTEDGKYNISSTVLWNSMTDGARLFIMIYVGGSYKAYNISFAGGAGDTSVFIATTLDLSADDVVDIRVRQESGGSLNVKSGDSGARTFVTLHKVA